MTHIGASFTTTRHFWGALGSVSELSDLIRRYTDAITADERTKIEAAVVKGIAVCADPNKLVPLLVPIIDARFPEPVFAKLINVLGMSTPGLDALSTLLNNNPRLDENIGFRIIRLFGSKGLVLTLADLYEKTDNNKMKRVISKALLEGIAYCEKESQSASLAMLVHRTRLDPNVLAVAAAALWRLRNEPAFPRVQASAVSTLVRLQPARI